MSGQSDAAALHLKLDRVLAELAGIRAWQNDHEEALSALTAGLDLLRQGQDDTRATVAELVDAADQDGVEGGELAVVLLRINSRLDQMVADGTRMVTVLNTLPRAMSDAAMDGVRLALGEGLDVLPQPPAASSAP